jgi:type IV pilus assembly protein PilF
MLQVIERPNRRRRLIFLILIPCLLGASAIGFYCYAVYQWRLTQKAVKEDRLAEAQHGLDLCLFVWPRSIPVHLLAARVARLSGDVDAAESHLNRCLKLSKGATEEVQVEFLLLRVQQGEEDEVAPLLMEYVENKYSETPLILKTLARAYMHSLRYGLAYDCLDRLAREEPDSALPFHWRGWVSERMNNPTAAMIDYQHALGLDPGITALRLRVAEMFLEDHNPIEATPYLESLIKEFPDRADVMARLGQCRFLQGQEEEARSLLEAAVEKIPDDPAVLLYLAKLDLQDGDPAKAEQRLIQLLKVDPYDTEGRYCLYMSLEKQGRQEEAATAQIEWKQVKTQLEQANDLLKAEATHPSYDANTAYKIGSALINVAQENLGLYWFIKALERDSTFQPALVALAELYEKRGSPEKAAQYRRRLPEPAKNQSSSNSK